MGLWLERRKLIGLNKVKDKPTAQLPGQVSDKNYKDDYDALTTCS